MARIFVTCPETRMALYTGLDMDKSEFKSSEFRNKKVKYSHCRQVHECHKEDTYLVGADVGS